jgi:hypothetical protein
VLPARQGNYDLRLTGRVVDAALAGGMIRLVIDEGEPADSGLVTVIGRGQPVPGDLRRAASVFLTNGEALHIMVGGAT